jgi:hypothetical protein
MAARKPFWPLRGEQVVFVLTVVLALIPTFVTGHMALGSWSALALVACAAGFIGLGLIDHSAEKGESGRVSFWIRFSLQAILMTVLLWLTRLSGMSVLIAFALAGEAVACLPPR